MIICKEKAILELLSAFGGLPPPNPKLLDGMMPEEYMYVSSQFEGKRWENVAFSTEGEVIALWTLLSEIGYCYYLPSLLLSALKFHDEWFVRTQVFSAFGTDDRTRKRNLSVLSRLSDAQLKSIAGALRCLAQLIKEVNNRKYRTKLIESSHMIESLVKVRLETRIQG